ncbi:MAG TPA: hypothetical protein VKT29_16350, partial [Terriglobales bacterium]|nr:hypothetical protein [Terriglobales bacterium]
KCNFYPSDAVTFTSAGSKTIAMTISTQQTTPKTAGLPVTISAATAGAPAAKTQTVLLTVKNDPDYQVTSKPEGLRVHPGETVSAQLTFSALSNYKGTVAASCGTSTVPGAACALSSSAVYLTNASSNALTLTLTIPATALVGSYTASVNTHDLSGSPEHTILLSVLVLPDFTVQLPQGSTVTVKQGGTASYALQVTPLGGVFNNPVRLSCSGLPRNSGYSFSPAVVIPGSNGASVTLKVTTSTVLAKLMRPKPIQAIWAAVLLPMLGLALGGLRSLRLRAMLALGIALTILALLFLLAGCGGGASSAAPIVPPPDTATPTGTYTLTLTATSADITHSFDVTLIVQ